MSVTLLKLLLYIPFLLTAVTVGAIFLVAGYKKGLWRALISLGVTVVSTVLSIIGANLLAGVVAKPLLIGLLPEDLLEELGVFQNYAFSFVEGFLGVIVSLVLFSVFLCIFLIVLKIVGNRILPAKLTTEKKALKWAGLGVRFVDTVLVSLLLLLPIYGFAATVVSPARQVAEMAENADPEIAEYLAAADSHPIITLYKAGPAKWTFHFLAGMDVNGVSINISNIIGHADKVVSIVNRIKGSEGEDRIQACKQLNDYLRENIIEEEWCYDMLRSAADAIEEELDQIEDEDERRITQQVLNLVDMDREQFQSNGIALSEFVSFALEQDFDKLEEEGSYVQLSERLSEDLGELLYHSEQSVAMQKILLTNKVAMLMEEDMDKKEAEKAASRFVDKYFGDGTLSASQKTRGADAMLLILFDDDEGTVVEGFARHPLFGTKAAQELLTDQRILRICGYEQHDAEYSVALQTLQSSPQIRTTLAELLNSYPNAPMSDERFADQVRSLVKPLIQK